MPSRLGLVLIVLPDILYGISGPNDLSWAFLSLRRPHCKAGQEASMRDFEFEESVGHIAAIYERINTQHIAGMRPMCGKT